MPITPAMMYLQQSVTVCEGGKNTPHAHEEPVHFGGQQHADLVAHGHDAKLEAVHEEHKANDDKEHAVDFGVHGVALLVHGAPQDDAQDTQRDEDDRACRTWRETREEGNTSEPACMHLRM